MVWSTEDDSLSLDVSKRPSATGKWTKRTVLKETAAIFDPLCLFAPFTLRAKMLFQQSWNSMIDWDDVLLEDQQKQWNAWFSELAELDTIDAFTADQEIHVFSDASEQAYAAAVHICCIRKHG